MSKQSASANEELGFSAAMEELESILRGVESEETDIDVLGDELKRAAELLELCRAKIRRAEIEVTQIVQSLRDDSAANDAAEVEAPEAGEGSEADPEASDDEELPF